jgi:hypothetical protein
VVRVRLDIPRRPGRWLATWRALAILLLVGSVAQTPLIGHDPSSSGTRKVIPLPVGTPRQVVVAVDRSRSMDLVDPRRRRVEGIHKLLLGLDPTDEAGLVLFDGHSTEAVVPRSGVSAASVQSMLREAAAEPTGAMPPNLNLTLQSILARLEADPQDADRSVVLISNARMQKGEDVDATTDALRQTTRAYEDAGVNLYAIAVDPYATQARALVSTARTQMGGIEIEDGNGFSEVFSRVLAQIQGHGENARIARLDPTAKVLEKAELRESVYVGRHTETLQLDVIAEPDHAGSIPLRVSLNDPSGAEVPPTLAGVGSAFYRIRQPARGEWTYTVNPDRKARVAHYALAGSSPKIVHYFPAVVEVGGAIPLHFAVVGPQGLVKHGQFRAGGVVYSIARAEVVVLGPDGATEVIRADLEDRQSRYAGEHTIDRWQADAAGAHGVDITVYLRAQSVVHGSLCAMRNRDPIVIQAVEDRSRLPMVSLASVTPVQGDAGPIALRDAAGEPHSLGVHADVMDTGDVPPAPSMLGRTISARVVRGGGWESAEPGAQATLTGRVRPVGPSTIELETESTTSRRVRYSYPARRTRTRDMVYLERSGYYEVELLPGPTYRVDPDRRTAIRHAGRRSLLRFLRPKYVPPPELPLLPDVVDAGADVQDSPEPATLSR